MGYSQKQKSMKIYKKGKIHAKSIKISKSRKIDENL